MSDLPDRISIMEVGPRDGLQIEKKHLDVMEKSRFIAAILASGVRDIEVGSFVNPKAVPQMANSEELVALLPDRPDVRYRGLWLNEKGL